GIPAMKGFLSKNVRGLTMFEVLIVIAVLMVVAALLLATQSQRRPNRYRETACANNLKQVSIAFLIWAGDHRDKFPMQLSVSNGGTMEFIGTPETFRHFQVMSNELGTPRILFCPA